MGAKEGAIVGGIVGLTASLFEYKEEKEEEEKAIFPEAKVVTWPAFYATEGAIVGSVID